MGDIENEVKYPDYVDNEDVFDQALDKIMKALYAKRAEFLFGSGMSKSSNVPRGTELAEALFEEFFPKTSAIRPDKMILSSLSQKYPLEVVAEAFKRMKEEEKEGEGEKELITAVESVLSLTQKRDDDLYNLFNSICFMGEDPLVNRIFTTNFDCLFEEDSGKKWIPVGYADNDQLRQIKRAEIPQIPVIHLHGLFGQRLIIAEKEVFEWEDWTCTQEFGYALANADAFVFVGYSMLDPDLRTVYMRYHKKILDRGYGPNNKDTAVFVVSPPDNSFDYTIGSSMWRARGALWIPLDALSFFKKLRHCMEFESGSQRLEELKDRLDTEDKIVLGERIDRVARLLRVKREDAIQFFYMARKPLWR